MKLTVVLPTITGREHWLERFKASLVAHTKDYELIVIPDRPACGIAWQEGIEKSQGDYVALLPDDSEVHAGWAEAAMETCDRGFLPAPLVLHTDGSIQSCGGTWEALEDDGVPTEFTRLPFMSREQIERIGPMIPTHEFSDNWVSHRGRQEGIETVVCQGYKVTHHLAPEGRRTRSEDAVIYVQFVNGARKF